MGAWKNIDELEDSICMAELEAMVRALRKAENDTRTFHAAIQGIDLGGYAENSIEERRREIERRAKEKMLGFAEVERQEFEDFGISFEEV